jgi:hypothetical protein
MKDATSQSAYALKFNEANLWNVKMPDECNDDQNTLFVQYTCIMSEEEQDVKYKEMCVVVSTGIFVCICFYLFARGTYSAQKLQQVEWDMATVTAADYAVELEIKSEAY